MWVLELLSLLYAITITITITNDLLLLLLLVVLVLSLLERDSHQEKVYRFDGIVFTDRFAFDMVMSDVQSKPHDPKSIPLINVAKN